MQNLQKKLNNIKKEYEKKEFDLKWDYENKINDLEKEDRENEFSLDK